MSKFKGLGVAMVTPFKENGDVDFEGLEKLTEFMIKGGVDYLVVQGTTGESPVLSKEEKQQVLDTVCKVNNARVPVVFGIGGNNTAAVVNDLLSFNLTKVDGILSASPYYNKPTQEGIYAHYKSIAGATTLPVIIYNVPGRTASNITAETTLRLAKDFSNMIAVKEASGNMEQIMDIIQNKPDNFLVISGDDAITLPILAAGGDGVISVVGNAFPNQFSQMVNAAMKNDMEKARKYHYGVLPIISPLFQEGNPGGIKEALAELNIIESHLRLPLVNVSDKLKNHIQELTRNIYSKFPYQN
ncbi:4-hydroxy-tetrahydrodipicolinate synthase [Paracrocinitomix mangrovi]|nr:4-hydroxy-tetrahydrodipicolinate synthase [Paracrocinitomix mangrovi]UKN03887.1 4-hydroxy-tetrahydrodipicolinate synthase [Paracrocinitomix mangrovi]